MFMMYIPVIKIVSLLVDRPQMETWPLEAYMTEIPWIHSIVIQASVISIILLGFFCGVILVAKVKF